MLENALDYEGLSYYDNKIKTHVEGEISTETTRATNAEGKLNTSINNIVNGVSTVAKATSSTSATYASTSTKAGTSTYATNSGTATYSTNGAKATSATSATYASTATKAGTSTYASNAGTATYAKTAPTAAAGTNNTEIANTAFVQTAISNLVDSAPETLNTLNELSTALGNDPNFATTVANRIGNTESNIAKIIDGTTTVGKALKDADGNVITETYATKEEIENISTSSSGDVADTATDTTITDSTDAPIISLKSNGYTEQQTYSGKNLMKVEKSGNSWQCDVSVADDGKITLTNTATTGVAYGRVGLITFKANTTYTISVHNASNLKDIIFFKPGVSESANIAYTHSNVTVTPSSDVEAELIVYMNDISASNKTTSLYIQIEEGDKATTYEPYTNGASPNPDYPQEIEGLDKVSVKTCGKNLLKNIATTKTINGVTFTVNDDKSITANGTATAEVIIGVGNFKPKPNKTYIFTSNSKTLSNSEYWRAFSYIANIDGVNTWRSDSPSNNYSYEFTPLTDTTLYNNIYIESGMTVNNLKFYPMIRPAEVTDDTYEPYTETLAEIDLAEPLYEGDYIEYRADGTGVLHRKMASVVFDGSSDEAWEITTSSKGTIYVFYKKSLELGIKNECINIYSNHYKNTGQIKLETNNIYTITIGTLIIVEGRFTTVGEWKTWLQSNPVTVVYELATPQEIELTAEQLAQFKQLRTFEPITNVLCDGETVTQYYKNSDSGECVAGLQERVDNITNALNEKAKKDGSNASGTWGIDITGNAETSTKATQDGSGNVITETYVKKKPKMIVLTDSYGNPVIPNGGGTITPFINRLPALMGWSSNDYKASYQDGAGFGNGLFLSQLKTLRNSMTSVEAEEYTNIVVLGGYNDWQQTFISLKTAMQTFCDYAKTNFPNAIIQIGYISGSRRAGDRYNLKIVPLNTYRCASLVGAVYLRNLEYVLHDNCYFLTGNNQYQHPLDIGHELLAPFIAEALKTGGCSVARQHTRYKVSFASGITETVALYITSSQVNDQLTIANEVAFMTFNSNKTINDAEYFNIGTLPSECHIIGSYQSYEGNYPITVAYTDSSDNSGVCPASIHFNGRTGDTGNVTVQLCLYTGGKTLTLKSICIYANSGLLSSNEC